MEEKKIQEIIAYVCGDCNSNKFTLDVVYDSDGSVYLTVICANKACIARKKKQLDASEDEPVIWDIFDITGQGYDNPNNIDDELSEEEEEEVEKKKTLENILFN